jgi:hypothetical protein
LPGSRELLKLLCRKLQNFTDELDIVRKEVFEVSTVDLEIMKTRSAGRAMVGVKAGPSSE